MADHRPMLPGRWELQPQMIVRVAIYRNGGSDAATHICDDCIIVGLKRAKRFVDRSLEQLGATFTEDQNDG